VRATALTVRQAAPGVGLAVECGHRFDSLHDGFGRYLPLGPHWREALRDLTTLRGRTSQAPPDHDGWVLAGRLVESDEVIVYSSGQALADAINDGALAPLGGADKLDRWGLRARGKASRTRLGKRRGQLRDMGLHPVSDLGGGTLDGPLPRARPVDAAGTCHGVYLSRGAGLGWSGFLRVAAAPLVVDYGHGVAVRRAIWVADFPRPARHARRFPFPYLFFDGATLRYLDSLDDLPPTDALALETAGTITLVRERALVQPFTCKARYVFAVEEESPDHGSGEPDDDEDPDGPDDVEFAWMDRLHPALAHASVDIAPDLTRLTGDEARAAWGRFGGRLLEQGGEGPPDRDYLLCDRGPALQLTVAPSDRSQQMAWVAEPL